MWVGRTADQDPQCHAGPALPELSVGDIGRVRDRLRMSLRGIFPALSGARLAQADRARHSPKHELEHRPEAMNLVDQIQDDPDSLASQSARLRNLPLRALHSSWRKRAQRTASFPSRRAPRPSQALRVGSLLHPFGRQRPPSDQASRDDLPNRHLENFDQVCWFPGGAATGSRPRRNTGETTAPMPEIRTADALVRRDTALIRAAPFERPGASRWRAVALRSRPPLRWSERPLAGQTVSRSEMRSCRES
jgi:hypothetical protein